MQHTPALTKLSQSLLVKHSCTSCLAVKSRHQQERLQQGLLARLQSGIYHSCLTCRDMPFLGKVLSSAIQLSFLSWLHAGSVTFRQKGTLSRTATAGVRAER